MSNDTVHVIPWQCMYPLSMCTIWSLSSPLTFFKKQLDLNKPALFADESSTKGLFDLFPSYKKSRHQRAFSFQYLFSSHQPSLFPAFICCPCLLNIFPCLSPAAWHVRVTRILTLNTRARTPYWRGSLRTVDLIKTACFVKKKNIVLVCKAVNLYLLA